MFFLWIITILKMVGLISWLDKPLSFMFLIIINGNINKNTHCFYNFINPLQLDTEKSTLCFFFTCNWFICFSFYYRLFTDLSEKYSKATWLFEWRPSLKGCYLIKSSKTSACCCFSYFLNYQRVSSVSVVWRGKFFLTEYELCQLFDRRYHSWTVIRKE